MVKNQRLLNQSLENFLGCQIALSKKVFAPRLETEFWVKKALGKLLKTSSANQKIFVLDIFAGSGCIGIAILKKIKNSFVDFVDIDKNAISQIKINLKLNKIESERYKIYQSNLFENLPKKKYDFIFANPPYVALERKKEVEKEVLEREPAIALFGGRDGTVYIRKFLDQAKKFLRQKGKIFLEFDSLQKEKIKEILEKKGYKFIFKKDQFQKYRWLEAKPAKN